MAARHTPLPWQAHPPGPVPVDHRARLLAELESVTIQLAKHDAQVTRLRERHAALVRQLLTLATEPPARPSQREWLTLTQAAAGSLMGVSQPEVSRLFKGNFREYSLDRLIRMLACFDRDVEIVARPRKRRGEGGRVKFTPLAG